MDFDFSDEQKALRQKARDLVDTEIRPWIADYYRQGRTEAATGEEMRDYLRKLIPPAFEPSVLGGPFPKEFGGAGLDYVTYGILVEELSRLNTFPALLPIQYLLYALMEFGTAKQKEKYIPGLLTAEKLAAFALTEPAHGSDLGGLDSTAVLDGDSYVINGTKTFINSGGIADYLVTIATTDKSKGPKGISMFILERDVSPWTVTKDQRSIGSPVTNMVQLEFRNCRVPRDNLVGEEGRGYAYALSRLAYTRALAGLMAVGVAQEALDASIEYAKTRVQFGKPIGGFQLIQAKIADMMVETEAARLLCFRALDMLNKGQSVRLESSMAKLYACDVVARVTQKAVQVFGGKGVLLDQLPTRYFLDGALMWHPEGTNDIHRLFIAREVLGISAIR